MSTTQQLTFSLNGAPGDEPLSLALRRACDRCRKRKTRCDGQKNCKSCLKAGVDCSYLTAPKPLGRRPRKQVRVEVEPEPRIQVRTTKKKRDNGRLGESAPQDMLGSATTGQCQHPTSLDMPSADPKVCLPNNTTNIITTSSSCPILEDTISITDFAQEELGNLANVDMMSPYSTNYPPLNLYAPLMSGNLPFDTFFEAMTPSSMPPGQQFQEHHQQQQYFQPDFHGLGDTPSQAPPSAYSSPSDTAATSDKPGWTVPTSCFVPYVTLFFDRLYPVFPVLERDGLPSDSSVEDESHRLWDRYALHAALAAAVTIQLNIVGSQHDIPSTSSASSHSSSSPSSPSSHQGGNDFYTSDFWTSHALRARQQWDFMSDPNEATIMTSFFLFEYYGNKNNSQKAWYYLREAIGFALAMGLDDPETYIDLESRVAQRRCRLFWLLFITERFVFISLIPSKNARLTICRAYALQHKSSAILRSSIDLPRIFESEDPKLIYGFVSLVNLFKSVDDKFLSLWKGRPVSSSVVATTPEATRRHQGAAVMLKDQSVDSVCEIVEIQRLDITVTQQWLHLLAWQLQVRRTYGRASSHGSELATNRSFPFTVSRDTLQIISKANRKALESHGIGMVR